MNTIRNVKKRLVLQEAAEIFRVSESRLASCCCFFLLLLYNSAIQVNIRHQVTARNTRASCKLGLQGLQVVPKAVNMADCTATREAHFSPGSWSVLRLPGTSRARCKPFKKDCLDKCRVSYNKKPWQYDTAKTCVWLILRKENKANFHFFGVWPLMWYRCFAAVFTQSQWFLHCITITHKDLSIAFPRTFPSIIISGTTGLC